MTMAERQN